MDGFRNRVATDVVAVGQRDPGAFRSGLAEGLQQLGQAGSRIAGQDAQLQQQVEDDRQRVALIQRDRARSATVADRMGAWPDVQLRTQNRLDDLKNSWKPTDGDYQAKADAIVTEELTGFTQTLGDDPDVTERFAPLLATFGASTRQAERRWGALAKGKAEQQGVEKFTTSLANALVSDPTPVRWGEAMASMGPLIDGLDAPATVKDALKSEQSARLTRSFLDGRLASGDWNGTRQALNSGQLDAYLEPAQKAQYLRMTQNLQETATRQAELAEARRLSDARDGANTVEAKVKAGIVPTAAELRAARAGLAAAGAKEAELVAFDALSIRSDTNRLYAGKDATTMRRDRDRLAAKVAAGTATEAEQVMNAQLGDLVDAAEDREAEQLKGLLAQGAAGRLQAIATLSGSPDQRGAVAEKLEKGLGLVATLGPQARTAVLYGRETRAARPGDFGKAGDVRLAARAMIGDGMAGQLGGRFDDVVNAAWDHMTYSVARRGAAGFDQAQFELGMQTALGATLRPGGALQGGVQRVRGAKVWLPERMTAPEFDAKLSRTSFADAVYGDGSPVDRDDVLTSYHPVYIGDDDNGEPAYRLFDASGGALMRKDGRPFTLRPTRSAR